MTPLGTVELSTNTEGRECQRCLMAQVECPRCEKQVDLWAETEQWHEEEGYWMHDEYGPATGDCCGLAFLDYWEGLRVFEIEKQENP